jgi:alkanesulfonate monooxygenase SsuD/methylene tetrahydromethanopterin reductase-like flavin-dependent oxidoreductase (luciferase family)
MSKDLRRAGELCQGWLPAKVGPAKIADGRAKITRYAEAVGRDPSPIVTALQSGVCIGNTEEEAREMFFNSSFDHFRKSLQSTMTKGVDVEAYLAMNLIGSIDRVIEKVDAYRQPDSTI